MTHWDERFMRLAQEIASWSKDPRTKVGCVVVRPDRTIAATGFNGLPRGMDDSAHVLNNRPLKHKLVLHAEENAILSSREPLLGYTLYSTVLPCSQCACRIIQAGITRVVAPGAPEGSNELLDYEMTVRILNQCGVAYEVSNS